MAMALPVDEFHLLLLTKKNLLYLNIYIKPLLFFQHKHDLEELKAAISRSSRRGLRHQSGDDQHQQHQMSVKDLFGQSTKFTQVKIYNSV